VRNPDSNLDGNTAADFDKHGNGYKHGNADSKPVMHAFGEGRRRNI